MAATKKRRFDPRHLNPKPFAATVQAWANDTGKQLLAVQKEAARLVTEDVLTPKSMGGHLPVVKGNLRRSFRASTEAMPSVVKAKDFADNKAQINGVIDGTELGQTIYLGFQAPYAQKVHWQKGNLFVFLTAQKWTSLVEKAVASLKQEFKRAA